LRVIDHNSDAYEGDLDEAAYAAVIERIRGPIVALADTCGATLSAACDLVDEALLRGTGTGDGAVRLQAVLGEAVQQFHVDYDMAVSGIHPQLPLATAKSATTEEQLFIVYFFVFSFGEFADELYDVLPAVAAVCRQPGEKLGWKQRVAEQMRVLRQWAETLARSLLNTGATTELETRIEEAQSLHAPRPSTPGMTWLWRRLEWLRRPNVRFATKYALLVTLLSLPCYWSMSAYVEFRRQRLDWLVISAAAIMVPTVGGSAVVSAYRILGTCGGGLAAFLVYEVGGGRAWLTYLLLVLVSVPCFHAILHGRYPKIGQFALVAFGVVLISKWVAREDQGESAGALAVRRTAAVAMGILAGMLATVYVWPFEARVRLRQALSWWLLAASQLYARRFALKEKPTEDTLLEISRPNSQREEGDEEDEEEEPLAVEATPPRVGSGLQEALLEISSLLADTLNEPRLKGRFPVEEYRRVISACQRMLDAMVAIPALPEEEEAEGEGPVGVARSSDALLQRTAAEREQRDALVGLSMYVLASALVLKTPLPAVLPPVHAAQRRVAEAMRDILNENEDDDEDDSQRTRYVVYYTHVMLGWEVVHELMIIEDLLRQLYGSYNII
ncbi:hypothetical protein IWW38_002886, partial [Coemansia aciculifera]